jgi:serine/threonine protein kinase
MQELTTVATSMRKVPWSDFQIGKILGEGASGTISQAEWTSEQISVAVKLFKGQITSDGSPGIAHYAVTQDLD